MARGDVVNEITNVAAGASLVFQPGAGVEVMITEIGSGEWLGTDPGGTPDVDVILYDGALSSVVRNQKQSAQWAGPMKLFINNTHYLRIHNRNAAAADLSYSGIQTK